MSKLLPIIAAYKEQFDRVTFSIPSTETSTLETDKRVVAFGEGKDLNLIALMFQYGRYLLISSFATRWTARQSARLVVQ